MTTFRDSILAISPPWLSSTVGGGIQYAEGLVLDAIAEWMINGVKASMPGVGTNDALYLSGRDMQIDRGPSETDAVYAARLQSAVDTWATAGAAPTLLKQLAAWFSPSTSTPIRLVSDHAVWHTINLSTLAVTITNVGTNWSWDGLARWWRGWIIIDASAGPWVSDGLWGSGGLWGDGGTWGSNATISDVSSIVGIIRKWKPANVTAFVIVIFDASLYTVAATSPPNPSGNYGTDDVRRTKNACFWGFIT